MIMSFTQASSTLIEGGRQVHAIREDVSERWYVGAKIHFRTGNRSNKGVLMQSEVQSIQYIYMTHHQGKFEVCVGDNEDCDTLLSFSEVNKLAMREGFDGYDEFVAHYLPKIKAHEEQYFFGKIIHWTDFRY